MEFIIDAPIYDPKTDFGWNYNNIICLIMICYFIEIHYPDKIVMNNQTSHILNLIKFNSIQLYNNILFYDNG